MIFHIVSHPLCKCKSLSTCDLQKKRLNVSKDFFHALSFFKLLLKSISDKLKDSREIFRSEKNLMKSQLFDYGPSRI